LYGPRKIKDRQVAGKRLKKCCGICVGLKKSSIKNDSNENDPTSIYHPDQPYHPVHLRKSDSDPQARV